MRPHVEPPPAHHAHPLHLAQLELFSSLGLALSQRFCPCMFPSFSRQGSLNNRSGSHSEFILTWFGRFPMRCKQRVSRTTSNVSLSFNIRRQNVDSFALNLQRIFDHNSSQQKSRSFFVSDDLLRSSRFRDHQMPRVAKRIFPDRRFPGVAQCQFCPT